MNRFVLRVAAPAALAALLTTGCLGCSQQPTTAAPSVSSTPNPTSAAQADFDATISALEVSYDARVGVSLLDTSDDSVLDHRAGERFGFASSVKALIAAAMLNTLTEGEREQRVTWSQADLDRAGYTPVTSVHVNEGMTYDALAEAAVRTSDNAATNLVLARLGGPEAVTAAFRAFGDSTTVLAREEPRLNEWEVGSTANTSTPRAMTEALRSVLVGDALSPKSRATLLGWMSDNPTGDALIRAGAPAGWSVADKSGGAGGMRNDIAIVTPPGGAPIILSVLTQRNDPDAKWDDELVAKAAQAALSAVSSTRG